MPTTPEIVAAGVSLYAKAECALHDAEEAILSLREVYALAYANGDLAGGAAISMRTSCITLAAMIAQAHDAVMTHHAASTTHAAAASADVTTPYAELPALTAAAKPASGGR